MTTVTTILGGGVVLASAREPTSSAQAKTAQGRTKAGFMGASLSRHRARRALTWPAVDPTLVPLKNVRTPLPFYAAGPGRKQDDDGGIATEVKPGTATKRRL